MIQENCIKKMPKSNSCSCAFLCSVPPTEFQPSAILRPVLMLPGEDLISCLLQNAVIETTTIKTFDMFMRYDSTESHHITIASSGTTHTIVSLKL